MLIKPKKKLWLPGIAPYYSVPAGGGSPAYVFRNSLTASGSGAVLTGAIDIGTASADRLIVVGTSCQNNVLMTSVVVNGVTLTQNAYVSPGPSAGIFSGLVTSGSGSQTVTITFASGSFLTRSCVLWTVTGLSSNTAKNTATASGVNPNTIGGSGVTAGDLLFAADAVATGTTTSFAGSTETQAGQRQVGSGPNSLGAADWTVVSTSASFSITDGVASSSKAAASFR